MSGLTIGGGKPPAPAPQPTLAPNATLDLSRPYGQVYGEHHGVAYEQDGRQFDPRGVEIKAEAIQRSVAAEQERAAQAEPEPTDDYAGMNWFKLKAMAQKRGCARPGKGPTIAALREQDRLRAAEGG